MSGVFGIVGRGRRDDPMAPSLARMGAAMSHFAWHRVDRLCDEAAAVGLGRVGIGVFNAETQPASDAAGTVDLFMAGEFHHRDSLTRSLDGGAALARGGGDAALALRLYLARGADFLRAAEGIFCIAIWDRAARVLLLINDRFGLAPLYYAVRGGRLIFAPEIKAILSVPGIERRLDETALAEYVRYQQLLGEKTFFEGITLLPPATVLRFAARDATLTRQTYWDGSHLQVFDGDAAAAPMLEEARRLVHRAIEARLDARLGLFLSGGLDSRTILAVASTRADRITTVTYGHPESRDAHLARRVARAAGSEHRFHPLHDGDWVRASADLHLELVEGGHSWMHAHGLTALPEARACFDVNLSGVAGAFGELFNKPYIVDAADEEALLRGLHRFYAYEHAWPGLTDAEERMLYSDSSSKRLVGRALESLRVETRPYGNLDPRLRGLLFNLHNHSRRMNYNLVLFNNAYVENRCPYFDYELCDWMMRMPLERKARKQVHTAVLQRAAPRLTRIPYDLDYRLPTSHRALRGMHAALDRSLTAVAPRLAGSSRSTLYVDYEQYLRQELRPWAEELLFSRRTLDRGIFRPEALRALVDRHLGGGEAPVIGKFNAIMTLEMVMRRFFDG